MKVAIDAMSGDHGAEPMVHGSALAVRELNANVILVGDEHELDGYLNQYQDERASIQVIHTDVTIGMDEPPAKAVRKKPNASVVLAANLVKDGEAVGYFSAGNTGATMAAALGALKRLPGVKRPAIATPIPREDGTATVLIDSGANVDCKPDFLVQFAIMGEIYSREILGIINPKIGILSNGEEDKKGNDLTLSALAKLRKLPYDFVGNVESKDLFGFRKEVDVVTCDGFVGNITLKCVEGTAISIFNTLRASIESSKMAKTGAAFLKPTFSLLKNRMDSSTYGGAPLLGVNGICMIGHGTSNALAVRNAIRVTMEFAQKDVIRRIQENIKRFG